MPGSWIGFELAVRAILGQQITVKGATALAGRLVRAFGQPISGGNGLTHLFPTPEVLADASLVGLGLTKPRALGIRSLARAVCRGVVCPQLQNAEHIDLAFNQAWPQTLGNRSYVL